MTAIDIPTELGATGRVLRMKRVRLVERDDLVAHEVLAGRERGRDGNRVDALIVLKAGDRPHAAGKTLLDDFYPDVAVTVGGERREIGDNRADVRSVNDVVTSAGIVESARSGNKGQYKAGRTACRGTTRAG